jgi:hypothetical protein
MDQIQQIEEPNPQVYGEFSKSPEIVRKFGSKENRNLFPHQLNSIFYMERHEKNKERMQDHYILESYVSICGDPTGYGKTAQFVSLIARDNMEWPLDQPFERRKIEYSASSVIVTTSRRLRFRINTTIVLCNQSLVRQWEEELAYAPQLRVAIIKTRKRARETDPRDWDVIIITPTMYNLFVQQAGAIGEAVHGQRGWRDAPNEYAWKRLVYDEPPSCNVRSMTIIECGHIWLVSATPNSILSAYSATSNGHMIRAMSLNYMENIFFNMLIVRNSLEFCKQSWEMPAVIYVEHPCWQPIARTVRGLVSPRVQELIEAGDINGAIRELGGVASSETSIVELAKRNIKNKISDCLCMLEMATRRTNNGRRIAELETNIAGLERQIQELDTRFEELTNTICPICFERSCVQESAVMVPCCNNVFGGNCIVTWNNTNNSCPHCRECLNPQTFIVMNVCGTDGVSKDEEDDDKPPPTKLEKIVEIVKGDGKFIVCSIEDTTYRLIMKVFDEEAIVCKEIKGQAGTRDKTIAQFKSGEVKVLFLNAKNNGAGINLQECTDIILFHEMSEDLKTQIIGRANRIGRTEPLTVHKLITA